MKLAMTMKNMIKINMIMVYILLLLILKNNDRQSYLELAIYVIPSADIYQVKVPGKPKPLTNILTAAFVNT